MPLPPIRGHDAARATLSRLLADPRGPATVLLTGPRGSGKTRVALWAAQANVCPSITESGPCGHCDLCHRATRMSHPDLHYYVPHGALGGGSERAQRERYTDLRAEVIEGLRDGERSALRPMGDRYSIGVIRLIRQEVTRRAWHTEGRRSLVIDHCDALRDPVVQNALLKLLEEPPEGLRVFMTASSAGVLLDTIQSRVIEYTVPPLTDEEMQAVAADHQLPATDSPRFRGRPGRLLDHYTPETQAALERARSWIEAILDGDRHAIASICRDAPIADNDGSVAATLRNATDLVLAEYPEHSASLVPLLQRALQALQVKVQAGLALSEMFIRSGRAVHRPAQDG